MVPQKWKFWWSTEQNSNFVFRESHITTIVFLWLCGKAISFCIWQSSTLLKHRMHFFYTAALNCMLLNDIMEKSASIPSAFDPPLPLALWQLPTCLSALSLDGCMERTLDKKADLINSGFVQMRCMVLKKLIINQTCLFCPFKKEQ